MIFPSSQRKKQIAWTTCNKLYLTGKLLRLELVRHGEQQQQLVEGCLLRAFVALRSVGYTTVTENDIKPLTAVGASGAALIEHVNSQVSQKCLLNPNSNINHKFSVNSCVLHGNLLCSET